MGAAGRGAPTSADTAKVKDPGEDSLSPAESSAGVGSTQSDVLVLQQGWEGGSPLLLGEEKLWHVAIMQPDVECVHFLK